MHIFIMSIFIISHLRDVKLYFYARVALKILFLNEPPGELRNRIFIATSA